MMRYKYANRLRFRKVSLFTCVAMSTLSLLAAALPVLGAEKPTPPPRTGPVVVVDPMEAVQDALHGALEAKDRDSVAMKLDTAIAKTGNDPAAFVPQVLLFAAGRMEAVGNVAVGAAPGGKPAQHDQAAIRRVDENERARIKAFVGLSLSRLAASKDALVSSLAPQLDNREDAIRMMARELLIGFEDRSASRTSDFSAYRAAIEEETRAGREPRTSLVLLMYESDPGLALQTMTRACQLRDPAEIKPILWSEHVVAELFWKRRFGFVARDAVEASAVRALDDLSRHPRWWVRLYVAELICQNAELAERSIVDRLKSDDDTRVRMPFMVARGS